MIGRAHRWLRDSDPLLLVLRSSLVALLVNSNDDPVVMGAVGVTCLVALPRPRLLTAPWLWGALCLAIGARQLLGWHQVDDHIIVTTYWCGAIALGLSSARPRENLAAAARLLIGSVFAFAVAWKIGSGEFADGSFFRHTLLFDERFETVARVVGGTSADVHRANLVAAEQALGRNDPTPIFLGEGPRNMLVATIFTWWGIVIEAAVALSFLLPVRRRWEWVRTAALLAFATTTYLIVPVGGFGTLLLVLCAAQVGDDRTRIALMWGGAGLLLWAGIWPTVFL